MAIVIRSDKGAAIKYRVVTVIGGYAGVKRLRAMMSSSGRLQEYQHGRVFENDFAVGGLQLSAKTF
jgi:hypothetical protein